jgi:hypothetical protein
MWEASNEATYVRLLLFSTLFTEKHTIIWAHINLLIFYTETKKYFLWLVHVFTQFMGLRKDITDQFDEIIITIIAVFM